jgi:hypothetical protein
MKPNIVAIVLTLMIWTSATIPSVLAMDSTSSISPAPNNNDTQERQHVSITETRPVTENEWAVLLEAINASALSETDRAQLIANLHIIYDDGGLLKDSLSLETQDQTKRVAFDIVRMYYHVDDLYYNGKRWNGKEGYNTEGTHNNLAEIAGINMGLSDSYTHILNEHANDPDHWSGPFVSSINHYSFRGASRECEKYANVARAEYKKGHFDNAYKNLSYAMHYMDDLANPWHTDDNWASLITHPMYENYVESVFVDKFKQSLLNNPYKYGYHISSVSGSADRLAAQSHNNFKELNDVLNACTPFYDWKTGKKTCIPTYDWIRDKHAVRHVDSVTRALLTEALYYNEGLIEYVRRS